METIETSPIIRGVLGEEVYMVAMNDKRRSIGRMNSSVDDYSLLSTE
jgi:hypothetical protein